MKTDNQIVLRRALDIVAGEVFHRILVKDEDGADLFIHARDALIAVIAHSGEAPTSPREVAEDV